MSFIVPINRPPEMPKGQVKWTRPTLASTFSQFATSANGLIGGRGFNHVCKSWTHAQTGGKNTLMSDPGGESKTYTIRFHQVHPLAESVAMAIVYQGYHQSSNTHPPSISASMFNLSTGAVIDPFVNDGSEAITISGSEGTIPGGGVSPDVYLDPATNLRGNLFALRTAYFLRDSDFQGTTPTKGRRLYYYDRVSRGDGIKIEIDADNVRIWKVVAFEVPKLTLTSGSEFGS